MLFMPTMTCWYDSYISAYQCARRFMRNIASRARSCLHAHCRTVHTLTVTMVHANHATQCMHVAYLYD